MIINDVGSFVTETITTFEEWNYLMIPEFCISEKKMSSKLEHREHRENIRDDIQKYYSCTEFLEEELMDIRE